jgi:hypothetical protein
MSISLLDEKPNQTKPNHDVVWIASLQITSYFTSTKEALKSDNLPSESASDKVLMWQHQLSCTLGGPLFP